MRSSVKAAVPIFVASLNMRAGLVLIGPLMPIISKYFNLSAVEMSLLVAIPLICFAGSSVIMGSLGRIKSSDHVITFALSALTIGLILRAFTGVVGLFLFTFLIGISIAVMNYEIPAWVKAKTPGDAGIVTGIYVTIMGTMAALAVAISVPLAESNSLSWRFAMLPWMIIAAMSALYWFYLLRSSHAPRSEKLKPFWKSAAIKSPIAWALVFFFGLESMTFYATSTWLPTILTTKEFTLSSAAIAISISGLIGSLVGLSVPHFISKVHDQRALLVGISAMTGVAFFMMTLQEGSVLILWLIISNIGISIAFPMSLVLCSSKSDSPEGTRNLSTMMQSLGYIVSATGPVLMGATFDLTGSWDYALYLIVAVTVGQLLMAWLLGKPSKVEF